MRKVRLQHNAWSGFFSFFQKKIVGESFCEYKGENNYTQGVVRVSLEDVCCQLYFVQVLKKSRCSLTTE